MFTAALLLALLGGVSAHEIGHGAAVVANSPSQHAGEWSPWSEWSECVTTVETRSQTRYRTCSAPTCPGGSFSEARPCVAFVAPSSQWSEWGPWSGCSASCGGGTCTRLRMCVNVCNNCQCLGAAIETQACNTQPCCEWSSWSPWSACSVTCGENGVSYRTRQCGCPEGCTGAVSEQRSCSADHPCVDAQLQEPPPLLPSLPPPPPTLCITCYLPQPPCILCSTYGIWYGRKKRSYAGQE